MSLAVHRKAATLGSAGVPACIPHTDTSKVENRWGCRETVGGSDKARLGAEGVNGI